MANSEGIDDSELPTKPLPVDAQAAVGEPVAAHVPIAEMPTVPIIPPAEGLASPAQGVTPPVRGSGLRVWPWAIAGVLAVTAIAAVVIGLNLGGRAPNPAPLTSIGSSTATPLTPSPSERNGGAPEPSQPAPNPPPLQPTTTPTPTSPPPPSDTPSP